PSPSPLPRKRGSGESRPRSGNLVEAALVGVPRDPSIPRRPPMTLRTNARLAGIAFLVYIVAAMSGFIISGRASAGDTAAAKLASIAAHAGQMRLSFILILIGCFCALILAVTLLAITRDVDPDLALLAAVCRVTEGVTGAVTLDAAAERIWLAAHAGTLDAATRDTLAAMHFGVPDLMGVGATFFSVGSTIC